MQLNLHRSSETENKPEMIEPKEKEKDRWRGRDRESEKERDECYDGIYCPQQCPLNNTQHFHIIIYKWHGDDDKLVGFSCEQNGFFM